jgi:hypothetical protein
LHEASFLQKTDNVHGATLGLTVGGFCGLLAGATMFWVQPMGLHISNMVVLALTLLGAVFGLWSGSMVGSSVPNSRLKQFQQSMQEGRILLMVDVPRGRVEEIEGLVANRHPEAKDCGIEPLIPAFP